MSILKMGWVKLKSNKYKGKANFLGSLISLKRKECKLSQNQLASKCNY